MEQNKQAGLPADEQILQKLTEITHQSKPFYIEQRLFGAKWMRSEAESRIKEVAIEFANWLAKHFSNDATEASPIWEDVNYKVSELHNLKYTSEQLFDIFLEERSKNGN